LTSIERVLAVLNHEEPDRIPCDLGSTRVTGITKVAYQKYVEYRGWESGEVELDDATQQLIKMPDNILTELGVDIRGISPKVARTDPMIKETETDYFFSDEWGITWKMPKKSGLYFDLYESPLSGEMSEKEIKEYDWPGPTSEEIFRGLSGRAEEYYNDGFPVILESFGAGIFEMACRLRGYENFYMDLVRQPELACTLMDELVELKLRFYEEAADRFGSYIQFIREGDDIAGQEELLISPESYKNYIKPRHEKLFSAQKDFFPDPFYVFLHSDGAIYDVLPDFLESGVEVLNPLQVGAKGVDLEKIKKEFGEDLVLWGGGIDTQNTLPKGTPEEVRREVRKRVKALRSGGGYIFGAVHNIQGDVPPENIEAMFAEFDEIKYY